MKKVIATVLTILMTMTLVACGEDNSNKTKPTDSSTMTQESETNVTNESTVPETTDSSETQETPENVDPLAFESIVPMANASEEIDAILQIAWNMYAEKDFFALAEYDFTDEVGDAVANLMSENPGCDRYITYLDNAQTYAMLYLEQSGGYWWYFGDIVNGARQGNGINITNNDVDFYTYYLGEWKNDVPCGQGSYVKVSGGYQEFTGTFDGIKLNGTYDCHAYALDENDEIICEKQDKIAFTDGIPDVILNDEVAVQIEQEMEASDTEYVYMYQDQDDLLAYWYVDEEGFIDLMGNPAFAE